MTFEQEKTLYDSSEEIYMSWWLKEMVEAGMITRLKYQPKPFLLFEGCSKVYLEHLKTKVKEKSFNLLRAHSYQADWLIHWNKQLLNKLFIGINDNPQQHFNKYPITCNYNEKKDLYFSVIDVKGTFVGQGNSTGVTFPLNQKWVYQKYGIYVQKIIPVPSVSKEGKVKPQSALFLNTFTPNRYLSTDLSNKPRKIKYPVKSINEYLNS